MKIIYDSQIFANQEFGGISRYFCALAAQVDLFQDTEVRIIAPLYVNGYLKDLRKSLVVGKYVRRLPKMGRIVSAVSAVLGKSIGGMMQPDIVHETYYANNPTYGGNVPRVLTVYDMIHERCPDSFAANDSLARIKTAALQRVDHVFCISENTRRDLLEIHNFPEHRISVTYLGYDALPQTELTSAELVGSSPYLLYVGGRHGYKNFKGLLYAFAASAWLRDNFRLICFGSGRFSGEELSIIKALGLNEAKITHLGGGDDRLAALYKGAAAFVYPSKYEGFGIPPLEAMAMDCPVICSNASSIPEVVGDAGEYFDPYDVESIRGGIEHVLQSSERRKELIRLGRLRIQLFSWQRCAQETHSVYRGLAA